MGDATWQIAKTKPEVDFLALEVHLPGIGSLLSAIKGADLHNIRIINFAAGQVIRDMLLPESIAGFHIFFPDPWPKKRHHKRRLINEKFIELLCSRLEKGGYIHIATDWHDYAIEILEIMNRNHFLANTSLSNDFCFRPQDRPQTKFEKRGISLGHSVWDLYFVRK